VNAPAPPVLDAIAADLARQAWSVQPGFLDPAAAARLRDRALDWWREGEFRPAAVGRGPARRRDETIRTDHVRWLDFSTGGRFSDIYDAWYEPLRLALNRTLFLGLFDLEAHVTVYPPGSFYVRHLDRFRDASHRTVSAILYLNDGWTARDGGALRLFLPGPDGAETAHDVLPEAGTLVTFLSAAIPHEVLPTRRERLSFTGWFCTRR
jgi:SM-20-related protein